MTGAAHIRIVVIAAWAALLTHSAGAQSTSLRTFTIDKPASERAADVRDRGASDAPVRPAHLPSAYDTIQTSLGIGYVEGADWGADILAAGAFSSTQVQLEGLVTRGTRGLAFDHGTLSLSDAGGRWRVEGGDLFSSGRGPARGARLTWRAAGGRQPTIAVYSPGPASDVRSTVLAYRDGIRLGAQTLLDAEIASDGSHLLRTSMSLHGVGVDLSYRGAPHHQRERDRALSVTVPIWRGIAMSGSLLHSDRDGTRSEWRQITLHLPFSRFLDLSIDRAYAASNTIARVSGASLGLTAGRLRLFHRYQSGVVTIPAVDVEARASQEQLQSMAEFTPHARVHLGLQLATQWTGTGQPQTWEELETTVKVTRGTSLNVAFPMLSPRNSDRTHARLTQDLPRRYSISAEYGRVSSFQPLADGRAPSQFRVMVRKTFDVRTPAAGGDVRGRVVDQNGRPVSGARVTLGAYSTDANDDGSYAFTHVPRADYVLGLDDGFLPADYAWDGRTLLLAMTSAMHARRDLVVAPLNAIYGHAFCDRNENGSVDAGEGVAGVVVMLGETATMTGADGMYRFANVEPGDYHVRVAPDHLPEGYVIADAGTLAITRRDDRPVTGADFRMSERQKPIIWQGRLQ